MAKAKKKKKAPKLLRGAAARRSDARFRAKLQREADREAGIGPEDTAAFGK